MLLTVSSPGFAAVPPRGRFPARLLTRDFKSRRAPVASLPPSPLIREVDEDAGASSLIL